MQTLVRGSGSPVTVFAHGLAGGIADARPFGSGVAGTKVFYTARAHDGVVVDRFDYEMLARDLAGVAAEYGAKQAFGVSMGAGALCRLMAQDPQYFDRVVLFLPAVVDIPRGKAALERLTTLAGAHTLPQATEAVLRDVPAKVRDTPAAYAYAQARAKVLCMPSMRGAAEQLGGDVAVEDRGQLRHVQAEVLVLGCRGDPAHPDSIAEQLAQLLPNVALHIYDEPDVVWTQRGDLRDRISQFLSP